MTYSSSSTEPDMDELNELQNKMVQPISHFSKTCRIRIKDNNFLLNLVNHISDQRAEFQKFVKESITHNLKMCTHADDLIVFAENCNDDGINEDDLLELLRPLLSDSKLYKSKAKLIKDLLERFGISLNGIVNEIFEYHKKITRERDSLFNIFKMNNDFIEGASSAVIPVAKAVVGLSLVILGSATAVTVSTMVAENVKQFSQFLREIQHILCTIINEIFTPYEYFWECQIIEIELIIKQLEHYDQQTIKLIARGILTKAKKILASSESYNINMRQALNRDSILI
ncbi:hypothetical protein RclHR1_03470011 [Rhizophagus clarus]|uniref:Uncharacterized protein n=1 Tax=Rhizophagus clarus TaxID=94130 RepID=A0A2Z6S4T7_9GLOM|nr:hypothetical protein RclHR1_03470011 [Rhizophagus clarus]GES76999.1 hypothetical protein GLOIN_2v1773023 [Rhizophagus clarus]